MENSNHKSGNNFLSGFLLGVLIGGAVVFLLGTKKGKKILKAISEEGEGKISNILNKIEKSVDLEDAILEDQEIETAAPKKEIIVKDGEQSRAIEEKPKATRRFFKGISRHN